ncbi:CPBP family intramembrane glutamic endopeptidase [Nocardiopsis alba]|uniref:CPBP family intramembrane glutamic endopeptidase n=1 Tax=Nocardiopsis alba TaxID=53437 RepID=UPI0035D9F4E5
MTAGTAPEETPDTGASRRGIVALVVWLLVSSVGAVGLLAVQPLLGLDMEVLSPVMFAPAIGALAAWVFVRGGVPRFGTAVSGGPFTIAVLLSLAASAIYFLWVSLVRGDAPEIPGTVAGVPVAMMVLAQALGALGEEIGFRGLLLHGLNRWTTWPISAVVTGLLFGFWHVQYYGLPPLEFLVFVLGAVALTLTMAAVMVGSFWQRMMICTIIHTGANLALAFTGGDHVALTTFGGAMVVAAVVIVPTALLLRRKGGTAG